MKRNVFFAAMVLLTANVFTGCKKYEEGPMLSLRSKKERVANTWKVEKYYENGVDKTNEFTAENINYTETFTKEGGWSYSYTDVNGELEADAGKWEFDKDNEVIDRNAGGSTWEELYILKLKEKEFWFWYMDSGEKKEFHLVEK